MDLRPVAVSRAEEGELVIGEGLGLAGAGLGELGLAGFAEFLVLEVGEDFLGAGDDVGGVWQTCRSYQGLLPFHPKMKLAGATLF